MQIPARLDNSKAVITIVGQTLFVFGILGLVISAISDWNGGGIVSRIPLGWSGIWGGLWLLLYRVPPNAWAVLWCGIGIAALLMLR